MNELRVFEIRAENPTKDKKLVLDGMPIVYDEPTTINSPAGTYIEIIRRGALDNADLSDVRLLYNHDLNKVPLARTPKTMQLSITPEGLSMTAELPETEEARSVHTAVGRGDLNGMSFSFKVPMGGDRFNPETRTREIYRIEKVLECSIVPFPAYPQTSIEARSSKLDVAAERQQVIISCNKILCREV
jgi:HK97 family phage prohead protease